MSRKRETGRGWMIRSSPHNEDFVLAVAKNPDDLALIANQYIVEVLLYDEPKILESSVNMDNKTVLSRYGSWGDIEEKTFYISEVEIIT